MLRTARLILRDFNDTDLDAFATLTTKDEFMRFSGGAALSREQTAAMLKRIMARTRASLPAQFALTIPHSGQLLGYWVFPPKCR